MFWSVWRMIETLARASTHSETHTNFVHAMAPTGAAALWWLCDRDECTPQQIGRSRGARAQFYHLRIAVVIVEFLKIRSVVGSRLVSVGCVCVCVIWRSPSAGRKRILKNRKIRNWKNPIELVQIGENISMQSSSCFAATYFRCCIMQLLLLLFRYGWILGVADTIRRKISWTHYIIIC